MKVSHYPFPGVIISNREQFEDYRVSHSNLLDYRYQFEQALASKSDIVLSGVCPLTLQRTSFTSLLAQGETRADGNTIPDWRNRQTCGRGVPMGDRAAAHYALYNSDNSQLGHTLYVSDSDALSKVIPSYCDSLDRVAFSKLRNVKKKYDTILILNQAEQQEDQGDMLQTLYGLLTEGGTIVFHINFHYFDDKSVKHQTPKGIYWALGWDFMDRLADPGFKHPKAVTFWAQETGYLGPYNFIFTATK